MTCLTNGPEWNAGTAWQVGFVLREDAPPRFSLALSSVLELYLSKKASKDKLVAIFE